MLFSGCYGQLYSDWSGVVLAIFEIARLARGGERKARGRSEQEWPRQNWTRHRATEKASRRCGEVVRAAEAMRTRSWGGVISRHVTLARIASLCSSAFFCKVWLKQFGGLEGS
jgi:hypothetical protein